MSELGLDKLHEEVHGGGLVGVVDEEHKGLLVSIEEVGQLFFFFSLSVCVCDGCEGRKGGMADLAGVLFKDGFDELGDGGERETVDSVIEGQRLFFGKEAVDVQKQGFVVDNRRQCAHVDQRLVSQLLRSVFFTIHQCLGASERRYNAKRSKTNRKKEKSERKKDEPFAFLEILRHQDKWLEEGDSEEFLDSLARLQTITFFFFRFRHKQVSNFFFFVIFIIIIIILLRGEGHRLFHEEIGHGDAPEFLKVLIVVDDLLDAEEIRVAQHSSDS